MSPRRYIMGMVLAIGVIVLAIWLDLFSDQDKERDITRTESSNELQTAVLDIEKQAELVTNDESINSNEPDSTVDLEVVMEEIFSSDRYSSLKIAFPNETKRMADRISLLRSETIYESMDTLPNDVEMFFFPGMMMNTFGPGVDLRVDESAGHAQIEVIVANRRFLKLLEEIAELPTDEASKLIQAELGEILDVYDELYSSMGADADRSRFTLTNHPEDLPTFEGVRHSAWATALLAGHYRLTDLHQDILDLAVWSREQRDAAYQGSGSLGNLGMSSLYNRPVIATAIVGTAPDTQDLSQALVDFGLETTTRTLTGFDAAVTNANALILHAAPDTSRIELEIEYVAGITDEEFDRLLEIYLAR